MTGRPRAFPPYALSAARSSFHDFDAQELRRKLLEEVVAQANQELDDLRDSATTPEDLGLQELRLLNWEEFAVEELYSHAFTQGVLWILEFLGVQGLPNSKLDSDLGGHGLARARPGGALDRGRFIHASSEYLPGAGLYYEIE